MSTALLESDWVIDLDVENFFDSVRWDLILNVVAAHTDLPWVILYLKRWLAAPIQMPDGTVLQRDRGVESTDVVYGVAPLLSVASSPPTSPPPAGRDIRNNRAPSAGGWIGVSTRR